MQLSELSDCDELLIAKKCSKTVFCFQINICIHCGNLTEMRGLFLPICITYRLPDCPWEEFWIYCSGFVTFLWIQCTDEKYFRGLPEHFSNSKFYSVIFLAWSTIEYLHYSPANYRWQNGNLVPGGHKYRDLVLQVGSWMQDWWPCSIKNLFQNPKKNENKFKCGRIF
jgi:hypothetical protein